MNRRWVGPKVVDLIFDSLRLMRTKFAYDPYCRTGHAQGAPFRRRAYVMVNGRMVKEGPSADLLEDPEIKKAYLGI